MPMYVCVDVCPCVCVDVCMCVVLIIRQLMEQNLCMHAHTHTHLVRVLEDKQFFGSVAGLLEAGVDDGSEDSPRVTHVQRRLLS